MKIINKLLPTVCSEITQAFNKSVHFQFVHFDQKHDLGFSSLGKVEQ